jgi:hypothetical protein
MKSPGSDCDALRTEVERLRALGQYDEAVAVAKTLLVRSVRELGPDSPGVACSLDKLATLYCDQGQYALAQPLYERSLEIKETVLGPHDSAVASALNSLAVLHCQGSMERRSCSTSVHWHSLRTTTSYHPTGHFAPKPAICIASGPIRGGRSRCIGAHWPSGKGARSDDPLLQARPTIWRSSARKVSTGWQPPRARTGDAESRSVPTIPM